ncbi:hypothetical protein ACUM6F_06460 [Desulforudis sp. DRI-14]
MELDASTVEKLVARIDGLEGAQKSQGEDINLIAAKLDHLTEKINQLSVQLQEGPSGHQPKPSPPATWIDLVKHYANLGKMTGKAIETMADTVTALVDSLSSIQVSNLPKTRSKKVINISGLKL